ncbi:MAG: nucleoprotein/polynucleotide-associated enzyme [Gammaproteobacteria bacterium]|nr:MAG: nucleoprotein/polynucleotide-associated enzyme [Gammaproteobacteria bacterium]
MAKGSLQDQLKQAGLASQKQYTRAKKAKDMRERQIRKGQAGTDETQQAIARAEAEKREKDRLLNAERQREAEARAVAAQIRQLIAMNRISERGETEFRYEHDGRIRTLMLDATVRQALVDGRLAIVGRDEIIEIVPERVAGKIAERDASWVILRNTRDADAAIADEDDPYAAYEVPDDLMW